MNQPQEALSLEERVKEYMKAGLVDQAYSLGEDTVSISQMVRDAIDTFQLDCRVVPIWPWAHECCDWWAGLGI